MLAPGEVTCVALSVVAPLVSSSAIVIGAAYEPGPTIVAPELSFAVTVRVMSDAVPSVGDPFESETASDAGTPFSVTSSGVASFCETVALIDCVESGVPVPSVLANSEIVNVSLPTGAVTLMLHCRPVAPLVQLGELVVSAMTVGAPPFTAMLADFVFAETYFGRFAELLCCGTVIVNRAVPFFCCVGFGTLGVMLEPLPPPHAASSDDAAKRTTNQR